MAKTEVLRSDRTGDTARVRSSGGDYHIRGKSTMGRLKELRKYIDNELNQMEDADKRTSAIVNG